MNINRLIKSLKKLLASHRFTLIVVLLFTLATAYYMTPEVLHISHTTYGFGDNTAGPIWRNSLPNQSLLGGFEQATNYPFGENIYTPVGYSLILQTLPIWLLSKLFGPIAGYNIFNMIGFIVSALVMYGFIYRVTRKRSIATLAGYAVSFTPYFQVKIGGHPGYGFQALLIGIIWSFLNLVTTKRKRDAGILGLLVATCFYFDPYFSLLAATCLLGLGLFWVIYSIYQLRIKQIKQSELFHQIRMLVLTGAVAGLLLLPLAAIAITKSSQINSSVEAARGNVLLEAKACSLLPYQYAAPFVLHPLGNKLFGDTYKLGIDNINNHFTCGIGEGSISISLTMLILVSATAIIFVWERLNQQGLKLRTAVTYQPALLIGVALAVGLIAMVLALPPAKVGLIETPSRILLDFTSTWRTLSRLYVLINISVVILFAIALSYYAQAFKKHTKQLAIIFGVLCFTIFVEYQAFPPLAGNTMSNFNYNKDVPSAYVWLGKQTDVRAIAEYPLEREGGESDAGSYYLSMQLAHHKPLLNSALSNSPEEAIRSSIKDLSDPQTVPVLEKLGVNTVVVHGVPADQVAKVPHLRVLYSKPQSSYNLLAHTPTVKNDVIVIARLEPVATPTAMLQLRKDEFPRNSTIIDSAINWQYEALQDSHIDVRPVIPGDTAHVVAPTPVCFEVRMSLPADRAKLQLVVDGKPGPTFMLSGRYQPIMTTARQTVELHNSTAHNMQIKDLGCR